MQGHVVHGKAETQTHIRQMPQSILTATDHATGVGSVADQSLKKAWKSLARLQCVWQERKRESRSRGEEGEREHTAILRLKSPDLLVYEVKWSEVFALVYSTCRILLGAGELE